MGSEDGAVIGPGTGSDMASPDGEGQRRGAENRPPTIGAVPLPSLSLLNEAAIDELGAQERRADALDSKAGVLLGFAGVLVGLSVDKLRARQPAASGRSAPRRGRNRRSR